jgi:DNA-binding transcriptional LysR family regulator
MSPCRAFPNALSATPNTASGSMRLEQLEYVAAVSRFGSLRRAGEHLHVSQAAVSEAIAKLERELGVTLLERHRSGAKISPAGRDLLPPIVEVLESAERLRAVAGDQVTARRTLRLGTVNAGTATLMLPAVRDYQAQHPGSTIEIHNMQQDDIVAGLAGSTLDVGLINVFAGDDLPPEVDPVPLLHGRPVAVLPAGHPLTANAEVTVADLRRERFVAMRSGYLMYRFVHRLFGEHLPPEWHSTDGAEMAKMMVAQDIGLTVLPDYSVRGDPLERAGVITARPIAGDETLVSMVAVLRRQARVSPSVRDVVAHLQRHARAGADASP